MVAGVFAYLPPALEPRCPPRRCPGSYRTAAHRAAPPPVHAALTEPARWDASAASAAARTPDLVARPTDWVGRPAPPRRGRCRWRTRVLDALPLATPRSCRLSAWERLDTSRPSYLRPGRRRRRSSVSPPSGRRRAGTYSRSPGAQRVHARHDAGPREIRRPPYLDRLTGAGGQPPNGTRLVPALRRIRPLTPCPLPNRRGSARRLPSITVSRCRDHGTRIARCGRGRRGCRPVLLRPRRVAHRRATGVSRCRGESCRRPRRSAR